MTVTYAVTVEFRIDADPLAPEWLAEIIRDETEAHFSVETVAVEFSL